MAVRVEVADTVLVTGRGPVVVGRWTLQLFQDAWSVVPVHRGRGRAVHLARESLAAAHQALVTEQGAG